MVIGGIDMAFTRVNRKQMHRHNTPKRPRVEANSASSSSEDLETSCEDVSSNVSESTSEFAHSSTGENEEENSATSSRLVSSSVCKLTDRRLVSLRSTSAILNDAASSQGKISNQRSHMTVYYETRLLLEAKKKCGKPFFK